MVTEFLKLFLTYKALIYLDLTFLFFCNEDFILSFPCGAPQSPCSQRTAIIQPVTSSLEAPTDEA